MAEEYVGLLDPLSPAGTDDVSAGDDQIRQTKLATRDSFPNVTGPVTDDHTTINTWESRIDALETAPPFSLPIGIITLWSALPTATETPPAGWAICDGTVQNGYPTPDLRGRFPIGANPFAPIDTQGGSATTDPAGPTNTVVVSQSGANTVNTQAHTHDFLPPYHSLHYIVYVGT